VLDSLRVWREDGAADADGQAEELLKGIDDARDRDLLRISHFLHLRCEVPMPDVVGDAAALMNRSDVRLMSLMDHTPGQRQFRDPVKLREYYRGKSGGMTDAELDAMFTRRIEFHARHAAINYSRLVELAGVHGTPLASHDDTTLAHVERSIGDGVKVAEFPTTVEAAARLHEADVKVLMGAPNLVRGKSHSGNVATAELARAGQLDVLSSDYVPSSLLMAALRLPQVSANYDLPAAIRTVSKTPAEVVGLTDRGELATGKRADLIRVRVVGDDAAVRSVWCGGRRVA
jgi:alpha-D-ribose 1-methylphosphonate 5-triphosphate diphosphatase